MYLSLQIECMFIQGLFTHTHTRGWLLIAPVYVSDSLICLPSQWPVPYCFVFFSQGKELMSRSRLVEFLLIATWIWLRLPFSCRSFYYIHNILICMHGVGASRQDFMCSRSICTCQLFIECMPIIHTRKSWCPHYCCFWCSCSLQPPWIYQWHPVSCFFSQGKGFLTRGRLLKFLNHSPADFHITFETCSVARMVWELPGKFSCRSMCTFQLSINACSSKACTHTHTQKKLIVDLCCFWSYADICQNT